MSSPSPVSRRSVGRNVYGEPWREIIRDIQASNRAPDGALMSASAQLLVVCWETGGGGTVGVIDHSDCGKRNPPVTLFRGHKGPIHDVQFSPYYNTIFATASEDGCVKLWDCPNVQTRDESCRDAVATLQGHDKKVSHLAFHHVAEWVLATAGVDCTVRTWDFEAQKCVRTTTAPQAPSCLAWNYEGSLLGFTTKDHYLRVLDPRKNSEVLAQRCHDGGKPIRCCWLGSDRNPTGHYILSSGFSKLADREIALWDIRNVNQCVQKLEVDRQSSTITPVFDSGTDLLFVYGRGDGNVRFFELRDGHLEKLGVFNSTEPARELAFMPKRGVDVMRCEVMRAYKLQSSNVIQPISFIVPRRNKTEFQMELFPPCHAGEPAISAAEWLGGNTTSPILRSMEPVDGESPFDLNRRPVPGTLTFSPRRNSTSISKAPSVLVKQLTTREKAHDDIVVRLQARIEELEGLLRNRDAEWAHSQHEMNAMRDELRAYQQYGAPAQNHQFDDQQLAEQLKLTKDGVMTALEELQKLREETRKTGNSTQQEVDEMKKLLLTSGPNKANPRESRWKRKFRGGDSGTDQNSTAVENVLQRCKDLERRNMELESLLVQLRVASGMHRSKRAPDGNSSDVEVWIGSDKLSQTSAGGIIGCAPGLSVCRGGY